MYVCWYNNAQQPAIPALPGTLQYAPTPVAATSPPAALPAPPELLVPITAQQQILSAQQSVLATVPLPRKRGSEELMSLSPMVTNGTSMSPQHAQNDITNDAKKVKLDENQLNGPSRVVHIRSLPHDVTETDIVQLGMPFGKMINVLLLKQKNQAFLEFTDEMSAQNMVAYYQTTPAQVRSKLCYVQFSNHKALNIKTDALHAYQNATAQAALQAAQAVMHARNPGSNPAALLTQESSSSSDQPCILRIIIDNILYPVTLEVLHQVFSRFGKVSKIITFTKNNQYQALIQFADCISARTAKDSLDGQNIYNGCDTLKIDYSKLTNLNVKYNNDKSRDYTRPDLPSGDAAIDQALQFCDLYTNPCAPGVISSPFAAVPGLGHPHLTAYGAAAAAATAGAPGFGGLAAMPTAMPGYGPLPGAFGTARLGMPVPIQSGSSVILVSNLDEQSVAPDALFTLFGVYGDVHRVKILFNKKDNALIQMAEPNQAQLAITFLDKVKVWGKPIRVAQSKHSVVQMPKDGQPDAGLTKDYTNSPLHRFKRPGSKNCQNIFPPSGVLHLSNIPPNVEESEITDLFSEHGTVKAFKFFPKDRKMALIQMNTVDEAVIALIALHNHQLSESSHLRVSFSKSTI
ncbi:polypyrimidine tract-binding protein 1-like isoform X4 [Gigantopelta aegis]|uniref:polypyrimidine tract-binding protein 1-like isoform X4 n=1 Tax=Gigantopelta aegis TaxID=1735272 RepID=UPI001B88CF79|nr:polypyrimidine tract-binding protein 1-like isoform X4 [Gigantopelta aegis]